MLETQPRPLVASSDFEGTARFKIIRRIGEGGTGYVYLAFDRKRGIEVALKTLRNESPYGILRLKNEFRGLAELAHRNLVNLHDLHQKDGTWFFTMEYVDGLDFLDWVRPARRTNVEGQVDLLRLRDALEQLVRGLSALHAAGRLHRDIKPSNLLVDRSGRLVILDFGLATRLDSQDRTDIRGFSGTLEYMAPEQSDGAAPNPASDWYSVGVVLFQALTGRLPFEGKPLQVAMKKRQEDGPAPSTLNRQTPVDLDELCAALMRVDPASRADELAITDALALEPDESVSMSDGVLGVAQSRVLVGREMELGAMIDALGHVRRGSPSVCMVHGPSGMGKSALIRGFLEPLRTRSDVMVLCGRCYERESVPYKAVDTLIDDLTRRLATIDDAELKTMLPPGIRQLARLFPVLLNNPTIARMPSDGEAPTDPREARRRAFVALRSLLHSLGHRWTLVIHIDDAHWGDADSASLLGELLRPPETPRFLLLCSFQSDDRDSSAFLPRFQAHLDRLSSAFAMRDIGLGPLDPIQARRLANSLLEERLTAARYTEQIARETGGHPYFIEALVRHLREGGSMEPGTLTLQRVIDARLERLAPEAMELLRVVCLAGGPIDGDVAFAAAHTVVDGPQVLSFLRAEHLVRVRRNGEGETIEPYHDRIGETVRATIDSAQANQLNLSIARALERQSERSPDRLVEHFLDGGEFERARQYTFESAQKADEQLAFDRAAALYERSLSLHRESATLPLSDGATEKEHEILIALGEALENAGRGVQAARIFIEAARHGRPRVRLDLTRRAGALLLFSGHIDAGLKVLEDVLRKLEVSIPSSVFHALPGLAYRRLRVRLMGHQHDITQEGSVAEDELLKADACWSLAMGLGLVDHVRAADFQTRTLLRSIRCGEPYRLARALAMESAYAAASGGSGWLRARRIAQEARGLAESLDHPHALGMSAYGSGVGYFLNGHWRAAQKHLEEASLIFRERCRGVIWEQATTETFLLSSLAFQGQVEPVMRRVPELLDEARQRGNVYFATNLRTGYPALAWLFLDDAQTAESHHREAMSEWGGDGFHVQHYFDLIAAVHIALYRGDGDEAWSEVSRAWKPLRQSMVHHVKLVDLDTRTLRARAALGVLLKEPQQAEARKTLKQDLRTLRRCGVQWALAQGQLYEGILFMIDGKIDAARARLATAILKLEQVDTPLFALAGRSLLGCLLGGDSGRKMSRDALADLEGRGVTCPIDLVNIFCPGSTAALNSFGEVVPSG